MTDIKDLLGRAIGDEPPLGIDRDEVFLAGRQRVRRRRALAAGGVVAAVVVAALGAATLTNFVEIDQEPLPPAAGDSRHAPPGPDLPLPPSTTATATTTTTTTATGRPLSQEHAAQLTRALFESGVVSRDVVTAWPGRAPEFRVEDGVYLFAADVVQGKRAGVLQVTVGSAAPGAEASCDDVVRQYDSCRLTFAGGVTVAEATWKSVDGELRNVAVTILPDGTKIAAMASNFSRQFQDGGKRPSDGPPVLEMQDLSTLIVKSGFRVF